MTKLPPSPRDSSPGSIPVQQAPGSSFPPLTHREPEEERIVVGVIEAPCGVRGEVRLLPQTDFPERFGRMDHLRLLYPEGSERVFAVESARPYRQGWVVKLAGCDRREEAKLLQGLRVVVEEGELMPLPDEVYYLHQVVGLEVRTTDGESLGPIEEIIQTGSNDVYVTRRAIIPALDDIVLRIDPEAGLVLVRMVEGLLREGRRKG